MSAPAKPAPRDIARALLPAVPRVETGRLILRGFERRDEEDFCTLMAQDEVARWITPEQKGQHRMTAWRGMAGAIGMWSLMGFGMFAVEEKASGRMIGRIGPHYPEGWPDVEIGWSLNHDFWGKGYAVEAAAASADWLFATLPVTRFISVIEPSNANSQRVAEKLCMRNTGEVFELFGKKLDIWEMPRNRWEARAE